MLLSPVTDELTRCVVSCHLLHLQVDNVSDHQPVCLSLDVEYLADNMKARSFEPNIAWHKASPDNLSAYRNMLRDQLASFISLTQLLRVMMCSVKILVISQP